MVFVDVEYVIDCVYVECIGVDVDVFFIVQLDFGEEVFDVVELFICVGNVDFIVVDFVVALVFCVEIEGNMGDYHVGFQVRFMS